MADETVVNGVVSNGEDQMTEIGSLKQNEDLDLGNDSKFSVLNQMIEALKVEKSELEQENEVKNQKIMDLTDEVDAYKKEKAETKERLAEMQTQVDQSKEHENAFKVIAARAADLETEVSRLQHDLISTMSESEDTVTELRQLKNAFEKLKENDREKELKVEELEKVKVSLITEIEEMKKSKAESEIRVRDLEKKLSIMEAKEVSNTKLEEDLKAKITEKEGKILQLQKDMDELDSKVVKSYSDLQRSQQEKKDMETLKSSLEETLKQLEKKLNESKVKGDRLQSDLDVSKTMIMELEKRNTEMTDPTATREKSDVEESEKGLKGSKLQWSTAVASTGTVAAAAAVLYLGYTRRR